MPVLDHIVFAAADLEAGTAWLSEALGQPPVGQGRHALMSTHNSLWRLGDAYLEMIATDPGAPDPGRPRWFGLDSAEVSDRLSRGPVLLHWVLRHEDLAAARAAATCDPGPALRVTRDALRWDLTVPEDGRLRWGGVQPTLIHWPPDVRPPSETLPDTGLRLARFTAAGPEEMQRDLAALGASAALDAVEPAATPMMTVEIRRPDGTVVLFESPTPRDTSMP